MFKKMQRLLALAGALALILSALPAGATSETPHVHAYTAWQLVTPAGCLTEGLEQRFCTAPGCPSDTQKETRTILPKGHSWGPWTPIKMPTCTEDGTEQRVCMNACGIAPETRTIPKKGHNWSPWQVTLQPTCLAEGSQQSICLNGCGIAPQIQSLPKKEHVWGAWTVSKAPTCTDKGTEVRACTLLCGTQETREVAALGHKFSDWVVKTPATCTAEGQDTRTCSVCGATETRASAALGHNYVWSTTKAATCSVAGTSSGVCSRDSSHTTSKEIPALGKNQPDGHAFGAWTTVSEGDCLHDGSEKRTCPNCGREETRSTGKGKHQVKPNWYALRQPTLERIGQKVRYCLICDKIVERKDMTKKGYMYGLVARNFGPYVKDINYELATFKDRFTPLTFTQEGETVYPIVTDDGYYIGQLKLNVMSGTLTVAYQMNDPATYVDPTTEMLFLFPTAGDATAADLSALASPHKFGEVIQLGGQTYGALVVRLQANYDQNHAANRPFPDNGTYLDGSTSNSVILQEMTIQLLEPETAE